MAQVYAGFICFVAWASSSVSHPASKRAVALALINCVSQSGNILGSWVIRQSCECILTLTIHHPGTDGHRSGVQHITSPTRYVCSSTRCRLWFAFYSEDTFRGWTLQKRGRKLRGGTERGGIGICFDLCLNDRGDIYISWRVHYHNQPAGHRSDHRKAYLADKLIVVLKINVCSDVRAVDGIVYVAVAAPDRRRWGGFFFCKNRMSRQTSYRSLATAAALLAIFWIDFEVCPQVCAIMWSFDVGWWSTGSCIC